MTLPDWITVDAADNQLVGQSGMFPGSTKAEANAAAQDALDAFASAALSSGNLACVPDVIPACPDVSTLVWTGLVIDDNGTGTASGAGGTVNFNLNSKSEYDVSPCQHLYDDTVSLQYYTSITNPTASPCIIRATFNPNPFSPHYIFAENINALIGISPSDIWAPDFGGFMGWPYPATNDFSIPALSTVTFQLVFRAFVGCYAFPNTSHPFNLSGTFTLVNI